MWTATALSSTWVTEKNVVKINVFGNLQKMEQWETHDNGLNAIGSTLPGSISQGAYMHQGSTPSYFSAHQMKALHDQLLLCQAQLRDTQNHLNKTTIEFIYISTIPYAPTTSLNLPGTLILAFDFGLKQISTHLPKTLSMGEGIGAIHGAWAELVNCGIALPTYSRICATSKKLINDLIVKQFPLLLLNNNGWKLELLCTNDYPSWHKNNLGLDGSWKDMSTKLAAKEEDLDNEASLLQSKGKGKQRLSNSSDCHDDQHDIKKSKNDNTSTTISTEEKVGLMVSPTLVHNTPLLLHQEPKPSPASTGTGNLLSPIDLPLPLQDLPGCVACKKSAVPFGVYLPQPTPQGLLVSHKAHGINKENEFVLKNPLPNGMAKTVPEPALSPIKKPNNGSGTKQVKTASGTTDEFGLYWAALTSAQQDEYKADTEHLQSAGTWMKGSDKAVCDGTMY
ncbi:hypothetical protein BDR05DRAFT_949147 [Suillus weaverae]|nr:hypothetical protein BDR05DRAFT_949147 [Suillus weaverae]